MHVMHSKGQFALNQFGSWNIRITLSGYIHPISIFYDCLITLAAASDGKEETHIEHVKLNASKLRNLSESAPMTYSE